MAHATYLREKARSLCVERPLTIDELAERLALSRSTVYYWVRDLPIPGSGPGGVWPEAARRKGNIAMQRKYRLLREAAYEQGVREYEALARESNSNRLSGRAWRYQHGVVEVRLGDTQLRARLQAWTDRLRTEWQ